MAFRMSTALQNHLVNTGVVEQIAGGKGTAGSASLDIYTGTQPATADEAPTGDLICTISGIQWEETTSGTSGLLATSYVGTAGTLGGTAGWGRMEMVGTAGTIRIDGDLGTAGFNVFTINIAEVEPGMPVTLLSADVYMA